MHKEEAGHRTEGLLQDGVVAEGLMGAGDSLKLSGAVVGAISAASDS